MHRSTSGRTQTRTRAARTQFVEFLTPSTPRWSGFAADDTGVTGVDCDEQGVDVLASYRCVRALTRRTQVVHPQARRAYVCFERQ